ncbi:MAG TPA: T9SS type A sorting domain-containing protein [Flavobacteriaceae bacterium]|nr:T9SS type A sorting domain-containing protein [Flavobacteriaceae bacterium]
MFAPIITNTVSTEIVENLGIENNSKLADQIILYPNPAENELHIQMTSGILLKRMTIYNLQGQEILVQKRKEAINIENLTSGMYLLKIETDKGTLVRQLIKN